MESDDNIIRFKVDVKTFDDYTLEIDTYDLSGQLIQQHVDLKENAIKHGLSSLGYVRTEVGKYRFKGYNTKLQKEVYGKYPWFWDKEDRSCLNLKEFWARVYTGEIIDPVMVDVEG
jgi:hypothetical protein